MKVLCHVGPNCKSLFKYISLGFCNNADVYYLSGDYRSDETNFAITYNGLVDSIYVDYEITAEDRDIIARCRLLRSLEIGIAMKHVIATRVCINNVLDRLRPDFIFSESIDQFLTDVLYLEARKRDIPFLGLIRTFVNGYVRISSRGEHNIVRNPSISEVNIVLDSLIQDNYVPENLISIKRNLAKRYMVIWLKNLFKIPFFGFSRLLKYRKYYYHAWASLVVTKKYYFHLIPTFNVGNFNWEHEIKVRKKKVIFIPLQHVPEATIDYWCDDIQQINYFDYLIELIKRFQDNYTILIKEHPGVFGFRKSEFYKKLGLLSNVVFCPVNVAAQACVYNSNAVLVWTGSIGFEAILRGKPVLALSLPYYTDGQGILKISLETDLKTIDEYITIKTNNVKREYQKNVTKYLLSGLFKGTFRNDGSFSEQSQAHVIEAMNLGEQVAKFVL